MTEVWVLSAGTVSLAAFMLGWLISHVTAYKTGYDEGREYELNRLCPRIDALETELHDYRFGRRGHPGKRPDRVTPLPPPRIRAKTGAFMPAQPSPDPSPPTGSIPAVRMALVNTGEIRALTDKWIAEHTTGDAS
jgi:hypothetical protein